MKSTDPASLQNLNDIVLPARVDWWPLADAWYLLLGIVLIGLAWLGIRFFRHWTGNRYRRAAMRELEFLETQINRTNERDANLRKIPLLLKRTALSVFPRAEVAPLSGQDWVLFLNSTVRNGPFTEVIAGTLNTVSYSSGELSNIESSDVKALLDASRSWLKNHQAVIHPMAGGGN